MANDAPGTITPQELHDRMNKGDSLVLLDVREDYEREISKIDNDVHIPLGNLQERFSELDADKEFVVYCRSGGRSMAAAGFLVEQGFKSVLNLEGGINGWAQNVDPNLATY